MKEAAGEANMTVITIVLIAIVLGIGTVVVNSVMKSTAQSGACQSAGGFWEGGKCCQNANCNPTGTYACQKATSATTVNGVSVEAGEWYCQ
ncbi:MAG: hypothetical protein E7163_05895 [Firmicutes bacterium]|nr:hypothetical protein [Bacillota bacterium]